MTRFPSGPSWAMLTALGSPGRQATRESLVSAAKANHADDPWSDALGAITDTEYDTPASVNHALKAADQT